MKKTCTISWKEFTITESDLAFYEKMWVPVPSLCPEERQRRRLVWQNMSNLYHRECHTTGKKIISNFSPDKQYNIYSQTHWWSDNWNFSDYWRDFDFSRNFFEQWEELLKTTPIPCLFSQFREDENSDFTNFAGYDKNCYLIFHADFNEDCYYATWLKNCKNSVDSLNVFSSELTYECINCTKCFHLTYSQDCNNCSQSWFLKDSNGCNNCFGSTNLQNKEYYIFNTKKTKEEYNNFILQFESGKYNIIELLKQRFLDFSEIQIHKLHHNIRVENCLGDHLIDCKNVKECFDVQESENMKFCERIYNGPNADCYDIDQFWAKIRRIYEASVIWLNCENSAFCITSYNAINIFYSAFIFNCEDCFWCIWVHNWKYCIFNKQYSKEEYFRLKNKIILHMKKTWEWGEFFPSHISPWGYNETVAQEYYPLSKMDILKQWYTYKKNTENTIYEWINTKIPNNITEVNSSILKQILTCNSCSKNYKIIGPELDFHKKLHIPIPRKCPNCRHLDRMKLRNPRKLFSRDCDKCGINMQTTYSPKRKEKVYCEDCYDKGIY